MATSKMLLGWSRWLDIGFILFLRVDIFTDLDCDSYKEHLDHSRDQQPILRSEITIPYYSQNLSYVKIVFTVWE